MLNAFAPGTEAVESPGSTSPAVAFSMSRTTAPDSKRLTICCKPLPLSIDDPLSVSIKPPCTTLAVFDSNVSAPPIDVVLPARSRSLLLSAVTVARVCNLSRFALDPNSAAAAPRLSVSQALERKSTSPCDAAMLIANDRITASEAC